MEGVAHWDYYFDGSLTPRPWEEFCAALGLDPGRKLILYGSSAPKNFPRTFDALEWLAAGLRRTLSAQTAKMLLEVEAILFRAHEPFRFTSGWASPVYIDCRKLISFPRLRCALMDFAASLVLRRAGFEAFDAVAGGETAGIPFAAFLAERLNLPMLYVRKKAKGFGKNAQIEGELKTGQRVLLVEDLATDGQSKIRFVNALRDAGAVVNHAFAIFFYDIFPKAKIILEENKVNLIHLTTWWDVLKVCQKKPLF